MALAMCPLCTGDDEVYLVENLPDGRKRVECGHCKFQWEHGEAREPAKPATLSAFDVLGRFPKADYVDPAIRDRAERLKVEFLATVGREPDPRVAPFWAKYRQIFSADGLPNTDPADPKAFANAPPASTSAS